MRVKLSKSLAEEMSGGSFAQEEERALFERAWAGDDFSREELVRLRDGIDTAVIGCEAAVGSLPFEEAGLVAAAKRSGYALIRKLDAEIG
jgi:hypothetical protein